VGKTTIEWCDWVINPVKGICPMHCKDNQGKEYCYSAKPNGLYKRFKWNPEIRFDLTIEVPKKPSRIFVGSTMELFGDWIQPNWLKLIFQACQDFPEHTYIFLTKCPENLLPWSPFPPNCWVGVTATNHTMLIEARHYLEGIKATTKFVSLEPLLVWHAHNQLDWLIEVLRSIRWLIIGAQTQPYKPPKLEWIEEIAEACNRAGIPYFLKDNLAKMIPPREPLRTFIPYPETDIAGGVWKLRQEMPLIKTDRE